MMKFTRVECHAYSIFPISCFACDTESFFNPSFSVKLLAWSWGRRSVGRIWRGGALILRISVALAAAFRAGFYCRFIDFFGLNQHADL